MSEKVPAGQESPFDILIAAPLAEGYRHLAVLAGYATPRMLHYVRNFAKSIGKDLQIDLTIGMTAADGIFAADHEDFVAAERDDEKNICVRYVRSKPAHAKIYTWSGHPTKDDKAFISSANFSNRGLCEPNLQQETAAPKDLDEALSEIRMALKRSIRCTAPDVAKRVRITQKRSREWQHASEDSDAPASGAPFVKLDPESFPEELRYHGPTSEEDRFNTPLVNDDGNVVVCLSLLQGDQKKTPKADGPNWGHGNGRPRDKNEACFCIRKGRGKQKSEHSVMSIDDFFPRDGDKITGIPFKVTCHDRSVFSMQREQSGGKALSIAGHKAVLGAWIRECIGLPDGKFISMNDLVAYGRTYVTLERRLNGTYFLDFSQIED